MIPTTTGENGVWDQDCSLRNGRHAGSTVVKQATTRSTQATKETKVVRDDWDDDDEEEESEVQGEDLERADIGSNARASGMTENDGAPPGPAGPGRKGNDDDEEQDSSRIWAEANKKTPMPELIVSPASTSQNFPPPPPAALQPTLRILKRSSPSNAGTLSSPGSASGSSSGSSPAPRSTLAEREAQYQEARSRIFGEEKREKVGTSASSGGVIVARDPLGPAASEPELDLAMGMSGQDKDRTVQDRPAKGFGERRRAK